MSDRKILPMHTHGECFRCIKSKDGGHTCAAINHKGLRISADGPACKNFISRNALEKQWKKEDRKAEKERKRKWAVNEKNDPVRLKLVNDGEGIIPECPVCGEMPYSTKQCYWCGQKFIQTDEVQEYAKPKKRKVECFVCGSTNCIETISNYNSHKHIYCQDCGMLIME